MELIKELQAYDENLTVKEILLQISKKEEQDNIICQKYKNSYLKMVDDCTYFGKTVQVFKIESLKEVEGNYALVGEIISIREESIYKKEAGDFHYSAEQLQKMEVITEEHYQKYENYRRTIKEQLKIPMSW